MQNECRNISIRAKCTIDDANFVATGHLRILWIKNKEAYAEWQMNDAEGNSLAGVTRRYFIDDEDPNENKIIDMIRYNIENYSISRKKIFSDLEIVL